MVLTSLIKMLENIQKNAGITSPESVGSLISDILQKYVFYAAGIALLIYLISGGFQLMLSRGDPKAIQSAQGKITNALLGFVIVFSAYWIVGLIGRIFYLDPFVSIFRK